MSCSNRESSLPNTTVLAPKLYLYGFQLCWSIRRVSLCKAYYLDLLKVIGKARARGLLQSYISGTFREKTASTVLSQSIDDLCIGSVVVPRNSAWKNEIYCSKYLWFYIFVNKRIWSVDKGGTSVQQVLEFKSALKRFKLSKYIFKQDDFFIVEKD